MNLPRRIQWAVLGACLAWPVPGAATEASVAAGVAAYNQGEHRRAYEILKPLAIKGDATAQNTLGLLYANGKGVTRNDAIAVYWFRQAADQDHEKAQRNLAYMVANGRAKATADDNLPECR
jgi:TPR repeat protein